jgi:hypothetical protein
LGFNQAIFQTTGGLEGGLFDVYGVKIHPARALQPFQDNFDRKNRLPVAVSSAVRLWVRVGMIRRSCAILDQKTMLPVAIWRNW